MLRRITACLSLVSLIMVSLLPLTAFAAPTQEQRKSYRQEKQAPEFDSTANSTATVRALIQTKGTPSAAHDEAIANARGHKRSSEGALNLIVADVPLNSIAALALVRGADFLSIFEKPQRDALAMLFLNLHNEGLGVVEILWGFGFFPLGLLVYRSRLLPRFLGVWLAVDGFAYVVLSLTSVLLPQYNEQVYTISQPALFGEVALMLWLVIRGAKPQALEAAASSAAAG